MKYQHLEHMPLKHLRTWSMYKKDRDDRHEKSGSTCVLSHDIACSNVRREISTHLIILDYNNILILDGLLLQSQTQI